MPGMPNASMPMKCIDQMLPPMQAAAAASQVWRAQPMATLLRLARSRAVNEPAMAIRMDRLTRAML